MTAKRAMEIFAPARLSRYQKEIAAGRAAAAA
jgi:hypothetical protein